MTPARTGAARAGRGEAVLTMVFSSLARRISLRTSMSWALPNEGRTVKLAMLSTVFEKRGFKPRKRARTSYESSIG